MNEKIKIGVFAGTIDGVTYHRFITPFEQLKKMYGDKFDYDLIDCVTDLNALKQYDIITFNRLVTNKTPLIIRWLWQNQIPTVMDIDDYWELPPYHGMYNQYKMCQMDKVIKWHVRNADYVTTTTAHFAIKLDEMNERVYIFPNCLNTDDEQWKKSNKPINKELITFAIICGYHHLKDVEILRGVNLPSNARIVLCGYCDGGTIVNADGVERRKCEDENDWNTMEYILSDNYKRVTKEYAKWLKDNRQTKNPTPQKFIDDTNNKYIRYTAKSLDEYGTMYNNIDVLIAPLKNTEFNRYKSELKLVECGVKGVAAMVSHTKPYNTHNFEDIKEKRGNINVNGNVLFFDDNRRNINKKLKWLCDNPQYIELLQKNLHDTITTKYDLSTWCVSRFEFYKMVKNNKKIFQIS